MSQLLAIEWRCGGESYRCSDLYVAIGKFNSISGSISQLLFGYFLSANGIFSLYIISTNLHGELIKVLYSSFQISSGILYAPVIFLHVISIRSVAGCFIAVDVFGKR